jgi:hypothetical protein
MRKLIFSLLLLVCFLYRGTSFGQKGISDMIARENFDKCQPLKVAVPINKLPGFDGKANTSHFNIDEVAVNDILTKRPVLLSMEMAVPGHSQPCILLLKRMNVLTPDFICKTSEGKVYTLVDIGPHVQYSGVIKGKETGSIVALSFFKDEMGGLISIENESNFSIGKVKGTSMYALSGYGTGGEMEETEPGMGFNCGDRELGVRERDAEKCVRAFVWVNGDLYQHLNSNITETLNFTMTLFGNSSAIFFNENINLLISEIYISVLNDFISPPGGDILGHFSSLAGSYNGDLAHLLTYAKDRPGGLARCLTGFCKDQAKSICYSRVTTTYPQFPAYSDNIYVVTHEMGHVLARHIHMLANGTAITPV